MMTAVCAPLLKKATAAPGDRSLLNFWVQRSLQIFIFSFLYTTQFSDIQLKLGYNFTKPGK